MPVTKSGRDRSATLALTELQHTLYRRGRESTTPLDAVFEVFLDPRNLRVAWERVRSSPGAASPGPDGQTAASIQRHVDRWLERLADDLGRERFAPTAPRIVLIPKATAPGETRSIGILNVADRVVHTALKQVLEPLLEPGFSAYSFGFRPGRSVAAALSEAVVWCNRKEFDIDRGYAVRIDIAECFETVDLDRLRHRLAMRVGDPRLLALLDRIWSATGTQVGWWKRRRIGLVQGSPLSPLLCNLALTPLDSALADRLHDADQPGLALRYADDLLLLGADAALATSLLATARKTVAQHGQSLRAHKQQVSPLAKGIDWLGVRLSPRSHWLRGRAQMGYVVPGVRIEQLVDQIDEITALPGASVPVEAVDPGGWIRGLNQRLRSYHESIQFADNSREVFQLLDEQARDRVRAVLERATVGQGRELEKRFRLRLPRGFWTWSVDGVELLNLSARAPCHPVRVTRQPTWMKQP